MCHSLHFSYIWNFKAKTINNKTNKNVCLWIVLATVHKHGSTKSMTLFWSRCSVFKCETIIMWYYLYIYIEWLCFFAWVWSPLKVLLINNNFSPTVLLRHYKACLDSSHIIFGPTRFKIVYSCIGYVRYWKNIYKRGFFYINLDKVWCNIVTR